jgi:aldose 1-epimerase
MATAAEIRHGLASGTVVPSLGGLLWRLSLVRRVENGDGLCSCAPNEAVEDVLATPPPALSELVQIDPAPSRVSCEQSQGGGDSCKKAFREAGYPGAVLAPWPNRLRDGRFRWQMSGASGDPQEFVIPLNEPPPRSTALHGLLLEETGPILEIIGRGESWVEIGGSLRTSVFPFDVRLVVKYELVSESRLNWAVEAKNEGKGTTPLGIGLHPYFVVPGSDGDRVDDWQIQLPARAKRVVTSDRLLPSIGSDGEVKVQDDPFTDGQQSLHGVNLDTAFVLQGDGEFVTRLSNSRGTVVQVSQNTACLQLYTPPGRDSLAIEPMSCLADAFNRADEAVLRDTASWKGGIELLQQCRGCQSSKHAREMQIP